MKSKNNNNLDWKKLLLSLVFVSANFFPFISGESSAQNSSRLIKNLGSGQIDWANKIVRAVGRGAPPDTGAPSQKRLKARIAARMDAYRNMAEMINGVQVSSETTVENMAVKSDTVKLRVEAFIKGARQFTEEKVMADGSVEIELYLPIFSTINKTVITIDRDNQKVEVQPTGGWSLASALDLGNYVKNKTTVESLLPYQVAALKDFALPGPGKKPDRISLANSGKVTGLIIDATGLGIEPAMTPFIVGGGKIIYAGGRMDIDPDAIVRYGVTDYTTSLDGAKKDINRIGDSPMIIEANGATGKPYRTNVLLDDLTLKNLLEANAKYKFLEKLGLVIVI
jgi:hypothetical protein